MAVLRLCFFLARSLANVAILLAALVAAPLFIATQFTPDLQGFVTDMAERHLARTTVHGAEQKARAARRDRALHSRARVRGRGWKILARGGAATAVGWVPFIGVAADVASTGADVQDVCQMLATMDELYGMVGVDSGEYEDSYCHRKDELLERISARTP